MIYTYTLLVLYIWGYFLRCATLVTYLSMRRWMEVSALSASLIFYLILSPSGYLCLGDGHWAIDMTLHLLATLHYFFCLASIDCITDHCMESFAFLHVIITTPPSCTQHSTCTHTYKTQKWMYYYLSNPTFSSQPLQAASAGSEKVSQLISWAKLGVSTSFALLPTLHTQARCGHGPVAGSWVWIAKALLKGFNF